MSALPQAVRKQIAEAERLVQESKQPPVDSSTPPADSNVPPPAAPAAPAAAAPAVPPPAPAAAPAPVADDWEKKYKVLQGKYNAEVPRLTQQVRDLTARLQSQDTQIMALKALAANAQQAPAPAPQAGQRLTTEAEVGAFGADLYDFIKRTAREAVPQVAAPSAAPQIQQLAQQVQQLGQKVQMSDQEKVMALLAQQVPNWEQQDQDPEFLTWLQQTDPYVGVTRQSLLDDAFKHNDGPRVVAFFKGFQNENAVVTPPAASAPAAYAAPSAAPQATPNPLDRLVAPGAARAGAGAPNEAQKRIFTQADIQNFTQRKNQFVIKGKKVPDSLVAEEKEIILAAREGRISG